MPSAQMRISLLNPPDEISALKLRGWLQSEAKQIDAMTGEGNQAIIRLFLTDRVCYGFSPKKLDTLLQDIVDKFPAIYGIKLTKVPHSLSLNEMLKESQLANADLMRLKELTDAQPDGL